MAQAVFSTKAPLRVGSIQNVDNGTAKFIDVKNNVKFTALLPFQVGSIDTVNNGTVNFIDIKNNVKFTELLPFRVKFINIGVEAYRPGEAAPIGIAIIGLNNYVL